MNSLKANKIDVHISGSCILEDISFDVPEGSFFSVIGPNGAGKSVLIKTLLGRQNLSDGNLSLFGKTPSQFSSAEIGYVPQAKNFDRKFPARSLDLVLSGLLNAWPLWPSKEEKKKAYTAIEMVNAENLAEQSLSSLSGGELQRIYLARAFIQKRKVLILDEPATGIDTLGEADLYSLLEERRASDGSLIVMVTHDVDVARHHSDFVLLMNRRTISFGPPATAIKEEALERAFGHSQHEHSHGGQHA